MGQMAEPHSQGARVALAATSGLLPFLAQYGADAEKIIGPAGIDAARLAESAEGSMSLSAYVSTMERAAEISRCGNFGLHYGRQFPASHHGLIGDIALAAPNIATALQYFANLFPLHQESSQAILRTEGNLLSLEYRILDWRIYNRRQDAELTIAMFQNLLRHAYGNSFQAEEVHFEHPQPEQAGEHAITFNAPVYFGQRSNAILFRPGNLNQPMSQADPHIFATLCAQAQLRLAPSPVPLAHRVRAEIRSRLPDGTPAIEDIAEALGLPRWTLQRRLAEQGLTYSEAVSDVRQCLALTYLNLPHLSISAICQLLGYAELSPFSRACRRWFGAPPEVIRRKNYPCCDG